MTIHKNIDPRIDELDGLRAVAILLVISFHYVNNQLIHTENQFGKILMQITAFGWVGVDLFFVLSGFLIGSILIKKKGSGNFFKTFYVRRIVRIIPNYFFLLLIFMIIGVMPFFQGDYFLTGNMVIPFWSYFAMVHNIYMGALNDLGNDSISVTWSIGIEEQFYLLFPLIVYLIDLKVIPYVLVFTIVLAPAIRYFYAQWIPGYVLLPCRMDSISFGILIAYYNTKNDITRLTEKRFWLIIMALSADIIICGLVYLIFGDLGVMKHTLFATAFSIMVLFAISARDTFYKRILRQKILTWIGRISYSLYLFNYIILGVCHRFAGNVDGIHINNVKDFVTSAIAIVITFGFSWSVYQVLETPMVKFGKKFSY